MALRSLLRRIPGPRGHGISPPAASRFVGTRSEGESRAVAELHKDLENLSRLQESIKVRDQHSIDQLNKVVEELAELQKTTRLRLDESSRASDNLRMLGNATAAVMVAIPFLLVLGSRYEA